MGRASTLKPGTVLDRRFRLSKKLAAGGYGEVYEGVQMSIDRRVAIKVLRESAHNAKALKRFSNEAKYACQLTHPNTVVYYDYGHDRDIGCYYLAMEYIAGETLSDWLNNRGPLAMYDTIQILNQVLGSLEEAHMLGLVHRDVKPTNIMLVKRAGRENFVKLIDFGIAKLVNPLSRPLSRKNLTATGMMVGSPHYMAPEQIRGGQTPVDARTDVYSVACVAYRMLTGQTPFVGETAMMVATSHLNDAPPRLEDIAGSGRFPLPLEEALHRALDKDPSRRQQTAEELRLDLLEAVPGVSISLNAFPKRAKERWEPTTAKYAHQDVKVLSSLSAVNEPAASAIADDLFESARTEEFTPLSRAPRDQDSTTRDAIPDIEDADGGIITQVNSPLHFVEELSEYPTSDQTVREGVNPFSEDESTTLKGELPAFMHVYPVEESNTKPRAVVNPSKEVTTPQPKPLDLDQEEARARRAPTSRLPVHQQPLPPQEEPETNRMLIVGIGLGILALGIATGALVYLAIVLLR